MSTTNSKTHILIDYVNNLYAFVNGASDILDFYNSLGGIITGCSSTSSAVTCDDTSLVIPGLSVTKIDGDGTLQSFAQVIAVANITQFNLNVTPTVQLAGGIYSTIKITDPGAGYTIPPGVSISAPNLITGIQATAVASISSGYVSTITVVNSGHGYLLNPTITIANPFSGSQWSSNSVATLNSKYYFNNSGTVNWYQCTQAGTFGTTGPTHRSGTVTNGTAKLTYIGTRAKAESSFKGATLKTFMNYSSFVTDSEGYLVDIFLVNIKTKKKVKIKLTSGNSLCI